MKELALLKTQSTKQEMQSKLNKELNHHKTVKNRQELELLSSELNHKVTQDIKRYKDEFEERLNQKQSELDSMHIPKIEEYRTVKHNVNILNQELRHLENKLENIEEEVSLNSANRNKLREKKYEYSNDEDIYDDIDDEKLQEELIQKKDKLATLEYKIDKLQRKNMKMSLNKKTKLDIMDIKSMFDMIKNKAVTNKPLGSDIEISLEDLDDLQGFLEKEKVLIANKQKDLDKELHTIEKIDKELSKRITELGNVTKSYDDETSQIHMKLQNIENEQKFIKSKLSVEK